MQYNRVYVNILFKNCYKKNASFAKAKLADKAVSMYSYRQAKALLKAIADTCTEAEAGLGLVRELTRETKLNRDRQMVQEHNVKTKAYS